MKNRFGRKFRAFAAVVVMVCLAALLCLTAVPVLTCDLGPPQEFAVLAPTGVAIAAAMRTDSTIEVSTMKPTLTEARDGTTPKHSAVVADPPLRI